MIYKNSLWLIRICREEVCGENIVQNIQERFLKILTKQPSSSFTPVKPWGCIKNLMSYYHYIYWFIILEFGRWTFTQQCPFPSCHIWYKDGKNNQGREINKRWCYKNCPGARNRHQGTFHLLDIKLFVLWLI